MTAGLAPLTHLHVRLRALEPGAVPAYPGSVLRGAFGRALRRLACRQRDRSACGGCPLLRTCTYARLFEPFTGRRTPHLAGQPAAPKPYFVEPLGAGGSLAAGDQIAFRLALLGDTAQLAPIVVEAVARMARGGLGSGRSRFELAGVGAVRPSARWPRFGMPLDAGAEVASEARRLQFRLVTPLRLVSEGRPLRRLDFPELIRRAAHRHHAVEQLYGERGSLVDDAAAQHIEALVAHAERVRVEDRRVRWRDLHRYSGRQDRAHAMGGLVGEVILRGDLVPLLPTLRAAQWLHVGKGVGFGLGRVVLREPQAPMKSQGGSRNGR